MEHTSKSNRGEKERDRGGGGKFVVVVNFVVQEKKVFLYFFAIFIILRSIRSPTYWQTTRRRESFLVFLSQQPNIFLPTVPAPPLCLSLSRGGGWEKRGKNVALAPSPLLILDLPTNQASKGDASSIPNSDDDDDDLLQPDGSSSSS